MYSPRLNKIITTSLQTHTLVVSLEDLDNVKAQLQLVDETEVSTTFPLAERVYSVLEWTFKDDRGRKFAFIVLGLGKPDGSWGRVVFLQTRSAASGTHVVEKNHLPFDATVLSIALYNDNTLVISTYSMLYVYEFNLAERR
mgnify:CR=1 FL=1